MLPPKYWTERGNGDKIRLAQISLNPDGWRCRLAAFHTSNKNIKPDIVVNGVEGRHREGRYCLNHRGGWVDVGAMGWTHSLNARTSAAPMAVLAIRRKFLELLVF